MAHAPRLNPHPDTQIPDTAPLCPDDATLRRGEMRMLALLGLLAAATAVLAVLAPSLALWALLACLWAGLLLALRRRDWLRLCTRLGQGPRPLPMADMDAVLHALRVIVPTLNRPEVLHPGILYAWISADMRCPGVQVWIGQQHSFGPSITLLLTQDSALLEHIASQGRGLLGVQAPPAPVGIPYTPPPYSAHARITQAKTGEALAARYPLHRRDAPGLVRRTARRLLGDARPPHVRNLYTHADHALYAQDAIRDDMVRREAHQHARSVLV